MEKTRLLVPLAALGVLTAALSSMPSARERTQQQPAKAATESKEKVQVVPPPPEDPFDALEVLAESFGIDISPVGLQRLARREGDILNATDRSDKRVAEAKTFVDFFTPLACKQLTKSPDCTTPYEALVASFFAQNPLDTTALRFEALREAALRNGTRVTFLIATLPDPIDSFTGWQFDPMLDAIAQGISASDYIFERYHFPDAGDDHTATGQAASRGRAHEAEASVILFLRHLSHTDHDGDAKNGTATDGDGNGHEWNRERLVLLIVHENPSAGVHARALVNAIRVVTGWDATDPRKQPWDHIPAPERSVIRILGPTFSGSADSVARELAQAHRRRLLDNYRVRFISGSATDEANKATLEEAVLPEAGKPKRVTFHATVQPDSALMPILIKQIDRAGWSRPMAVLYEGNTQYGRGLLNVLTAQATSSLEQSELILLPFPMNVSRIRGTTVDQNTSLADVLGMPSKFRPIAMEAQGQPADQIPQLSPATTSSYIELSLSGMLQTMRKERVGTVALMATDPRDKLFLAQQISRDVPNVSILTAESDSLYIHPDYSSYLQGALIASTYPLYSGNQRWSYGFQGGSERREFANGSAKGIYNAAVALLNYDEHGTPVRTYESGEAPPRLIEYGLPGTDCSRGCTPPVWISVVGRRGTWPVLAYNVPSTDYVLPIPVTDASAPPSLATFPSPYFHGVFIILTATVLFGWAGARSAAWRRSRGFKYRLAALVCEPRPERGRAYLVVAVFSVLVMELFLAAIYLTRATLDVRKWEWAWSGNVAAAVLVFVVAAALADVTGRLVMRMLRHDRENLTMWLNPRTWSGRTRLAAVALCIWAAASLLYYASTHAFEPRDLAVSYVARAVDYGSGVSPTLPVLFLGFGIVLWSVAELARLRTPNVALADDSVHGLMQKLVGSTLQRMTPAWKYLNHSTLSVPAPLFLIVLVLLVAICLVLFDPIVRPLITIEGPWYGRFVSSTILIVQTMIGLSLLQFLYLWSKLRQLFEEMAWHRPVPAYQTVPRALCPSGLLPKVPRLMELHLPVSHWRTALEKMERHADSYKLNEQFQSEMHTDPDQVWSGSGTWKSLVAAASEPPTSSRPEPSAQDRDLLMEMCAALILRDAIARLGHNMVFVIGGMLFVFCSHTLFPFQMDAQLAELGWLFVAFTFGSILTVLIQMKQNEILRRLTSADPSKPTAWDSAFFWRVAVFALIPLLTLFAAQFPDIGAVILKWIDPVRRALP